MGLEQVIADVRKDGEARAEQVLQDARREAERVLTEARDRAAADQRQREAQAHKEAEQLRQQILSGAEFEARKQILLAQSDLREELRRRLVEGFGKLPEKVRKQHVAKLLAKAQQSVPRGRVWSAAPDEKTVKAALGTGGAGGTGGAAYSYAGTLPIAGGLVVESEDGTERLDLSYETLLGGLWRDVLKAESDLFA